MIGERAAGRVSQALAHPIAIGLVPVGCIVWLHFGSVNSLTLVLSIVAISITQLVLLGQGREARASKRQMGEIIRSIPDADDAMADADVVADSC